MATASIYEVTSSSITIQIQFDSPGANKYTKNYLRVGTSGGSWSQYGTTYADYTTMYFTYYGLSPGTTYQVSIDSYVNGSVVEYGPFITATTSGPPPDTTAPTIAVGFTPSAYSIYMFWNSTDSDFSEAKFQMDGVQFLTTYAPNANHTIWNLWPNTTYNFTWQVKDYTGNTRSYSGSVTTLGPTRPTNWGWYYPKTQGSQFNLTAPEWNDFTSRINDFRYFYGIKYKTGLGQYSFTTAPWNQVTREFHGWMYNQAVVAIKDMNPPMAIPSDTGSSKSAGDLVLAKYFSDLMNSLNSIQ